MAQEPEKGHVSQQTLHTCVSTSMSVGQTEDIKDEKTQRDERTIVTHQAASTWKRNKKVDSSALGYPDFRA